MERVYIARKSRQQGWREIVIYRKEHAAAGLIQRWTRGVLVRRRTPLVREVRAMSMKVVARSVDDRDSLLVERSISRAGFFGPQYPLGLGAHPPFFYEEERYSEPSLHISKPPPPPRRIRGKETRRCEGEEQRGG